MPPFAATFEIIPGPSLSPAELTALGKAIRHWLRQHDKHGAGSGKNEDGGLSELMDGRPIPSRFNRRVEQVKESKRLRGLYQKVDKAAVRKELIEAGDDPARRTIRLELFYLHDDRQRLVEIARKRIPAELVDDVLVNGRSWRDDVPAE